MLNIAFCLFFADILLGDFLVAENAPFQTEIDSSMYSVDKTPSVTKQKLNRGADFEQSSLGSIPERGSFGASRFPISLVHYLFLLLLN